MNILSREFTDKLAHYPDLIILKPTITHTGQFVPVDLSRGIFGDPDVLRMASAECAWLIDFLTIDVVAGIELAGVPLATAISLHTNRPLIMSRGPLHRPGKPAVVGAVNFLNGTQRVLLVDDLIAYGGTKIARAQQIADAGGVVTHVFVLLDFPMSSAVIHNDSSTYAFDGRQKLAQKGIRITSLLMWQELVALQRDAGVISPLMADIALAQLEPKHFESNEFGWLTKVVELYGECGKTMPSFVQQYLHERGV